MRSIFKYILSTTYRNITLTGLVIISGPATAGISISFHSGAHGLRTGHHGHGYQHHNNHHQKPGYPGYYTHKHHNPSLRYYSPLRHYIRYRQDPYYYSHKAYADTTPQYIFYNYPLNTKNPKKNDSDYTSSWTVLSQGNFKTALKIFSSEARDYPKSGAPKVGYAVAAAANGELAKAVSAMRMGLQLEPEVLNKIKPDQGLQHIIDGLISKYENPVQHKSSLNDAAFMSASLHYLGGNHQAARSALDLAYTRGSKQKSTINLQKLIDAHPLQPWGNWNWRSEND